jgi:hypothetical protein
VAELACPAVADRNLEWWTNGVLELLIQNSRFKIRKSTNGSSFEFEILDFGALNFGFWALNLNL